MSEWIVYSKDGLTERCRLKRLEYNGSFMNERTISATFEYHSEVAFDVFDYIVYRNEKFELESIPSVKKISNHNYEYELRFVSLKYELERCEMRDIVPKDNGVTYPTPLTFSFTGDVRYLTERIQANLDSLYGEGVWSIVIPEGVKSEEKNITISQQNCWNALSLVNTTYNLTFSIKGRVITVGGEQSLVGHVFQYGKGKGLYEIERVSDTDTGIVTKVRAYGGTRNLDYSYPKRPEWTDSVLPVSFALSPLRLMLPSFKLDGKTDYVLADDSIISEYGIREASVVYDDIYPSITGMLNYDDEPIDEIKSVDEVDDSKDTFIVYLYDLGFDLESNLTTENAQISMKSGSLIGYTFNISEIEKQEDNSYKITLGRITNEEGDTGNFNIPNSQWSIAAGDKFVLLNILMPQEYIRHAEERLLERAKEYLNEYGRTNFSYNVGLHDKFLKENANIYEELIEGSKLRIYDQNLGISEDVTIQSITITENMGDNMLTQVKVTLNNKPSASTIERIQGQIKELSETSAGQFSTQSELLKQYRRKLDKPFFDRLFAAVDINGNEIPSTDLSTPIAYIKARYSVASIGGFTMYLNDNSYDLPSIYDGLPIDNNTIYWEDVDGSKVLKAKGGGGVAESVSWSNITDKPSWLLDNKISYSEIADTPDLGIYVTETELTNKGYLTQHQDLSGYQKLITSSNKLAYSLISGTPTALKNPTALKFGTKTYDGSVEQTILASDLGALTSHQTIYTLTFQSGTFASGSFTANSGNKTINIPTTTSHISEGSNLYFTNERAVSALAETLKSYVTLSGTQTISGEKNFTGGLKVNGSPIVYDAAKKYWKLEGDLLITGGLTMYGSDSSFTPSTIMDAIAANLDPNTLAIENGLLTVIGGGSGSISEITNQMVIDALGFTPISSSDMPTVLPNPHSLKFGSKLYDGSASKTILASDLGITWDDILGRPTLLSSFTDDVVAGKYLPLSGGTIKGDLIIGSGNTETWIHYFKNDINEKFGAIGVSSSHEPLFNDNTTVHTIIHSGNYSSYALPLSGGTISEGLTIGGTLYATNNMYLNGWFSSKNHYFFVRDNADADWIVTNENWTKEYSLIHSGNVSSQIVEGITTHVGDEINANGDIAKLNSYYSSQGFRISRFNGLSGLGTKNADGLIVNWPLDHSYGQQWYIDDESHTIQTRYVSGGAWSDWKTIAFTDSDITGNAASAYKIIDSSGNNKVYIHSLGYVVVNGFHFTSDVIERKTNDNLYLQYNSTGNTIINANGGNVGIGTTNPSAKLDVHGQIAINGLPTVYSNGVNTFYAGNIAVTSYFGGNNVHLRYGASETTGLILNSGGDVGIGTTSPAYKLDVNGTGRFTGDVIINGNTAIHSGNYSSYALPLSGGTIKGDLIIGSGNTETWIHYFKNDINEKFGAIGVSSSHEPLFNDNTTVHTIIHSGNYSSYALPLSGGTITGTTHTPLAINTTATSDVGLRFDMSGEFKGWVGYSPNMGVYLYSYSTSSGAHQLGLTDAGVGFLDSYTLIHSGNIGSQIVEGITTHVGDEINANGDIAKLNSYYSSQGFRISRFNGLSGLGTKNADGLIVNWPLDHSYGQQWYIDDESHTIQTRYVSGGAWSDWKTIAFTDSNVASATKLQTARTIWGQSFDGTGNVDGVMTASSTNNQIIVGSSSYTSGVIRATQMLSPTLTASYGICHLFGKELSNYNTGNIVFNWVGDSNQNNRVSIGLYGADNLLNILGSGNVGIGTTNPLDKLHVAGNLRLKNEDSFYGNYIYFGDDRYCYIGETTDDSMTIYASKGIQLNGKVNIASDTTIDGNLLVRGGITMYSQRSLKNVVDERGLSLDELRTVKPTRYTWKDRRDNRIHFGGIADDIEQVLPEVVYNANGVLTMDYGNAGFAIASSLIKPVIDHEQRIKALEKENEELKQEIKRLKA